MVAIRSDPNGSDDARLRSPADIALDGRTVLQPDLFVVPAGIVARSWRDVTALLLAVEVVSPGSARYDGSLFARAER